jgi:dTDP-4-dehydrorhamnose reductase
VKILLLGSGGQIGWELQRALAPLGNITALGRESAEGLCGDFEKPDRLRCAVRQLKPNVIVNAAAYTNVDRAEAEPERAERINAAAPGVLADEAARLDALLVHYSTDYVFDGSGTKLWSEDNNPAPLNVYGATKLRGEQAIRNSGCRHLIFRTQWVYAARRRNFVRTMLRLACERDTLKVVGDQTGAPTGAELIADVNSHTLKFAMTQDGASGTYHLAARGETTWHAYACFVIGEARRAGWPVGLKDADIVPVKTDAVPTAARRPSNSRLCVERLEQTFSLRLPQWPAGVARVVAECCGGDAAHSDVTV